MGTEVIAPFVTDEWQRILADTGYSARPPDPPVWAAMADRTVRRLDGQRTVPPPLPPCCRVSAYSTCAACPGGGCEGCLPRRSWAAHINGTCACVDAREQPTNSDPSWAARVARAIARAEWSVN